MKDSLQKCFYIGDGKLIECYILDIYKDIRYTLMEVETYNSRGWGDPPYWKIPSQKDKHNYHFYASFEDIRLKNDEDTMKLRILSVEEDYKKREKLIQEEIKSLKEDLLLMKEDRDWNIKEIKKEYEK